jgi:amino acid transporter
MLAFTFILVFNTVETDFSMLIGAIGLIIFLTQAKHIKSEIRMFVYAGIIIYITAFFISVFLCISNCLHRCKCHSEPFSWK